MPLESFLSKPAVEAEALAYLRRESLDIYNRLHSIGEDVAFVNQVRLAYPAFAFLPNLRCGAWYTDPTLCRKEPAYFKSTDGHYNGWSFNLRRPNVHLLPLVVELGGMILVDSTRSGKRLPDALSKTVPIWCAVINRAVALKVQTADGSRGVGDWDTQLYTPPGAVSSQEHAQIASRLDQWARDLVSSSYVLPELSKPLRPFWITPANSTFPNLASSTEFFTIICVSASRQVHDGLERRTQGFAYVQGSGDDHELWGMGLTPQLFWRHRTELLAAERSEVEALVQAIVSEAQTGVIYGTADHDWTDSLTPIMKISGRIRLCRLADLPRAGLDGALLHDKAYFLIYASSPEASTTTGPSAHIHRCTLAAGKKGQHDLLRSILPQAVTFASRHLTPEGKDVVVACDDAKDASVGVAVALLQLFFDDNGQLRDEPRRDTASKQSIRKRLEWIIASRPEANPSRTTLKRVNDFLLSPSTL
ncbi:unnamed protein product [Peniophora sp. CBMAI 1063]|nr:unnamed protein product [Peniophora sp. CBMAI 1063]